MEITNKQKLNYVSSLIIKHLMKDVYIDKVYKDKATNGNDRITYIYTNNTLEEKVMIVEIAPMFYMKMSCSNIIIDGVPFTIHPYYMNESLNKFINDYENLIEKR